VRNLPALAAAGLGVLFASVPARASGNEKVAVLVAPILSMEGLVGRNCASNLPAPSIRSAALDFTEKGEPRLTAELENPSGASPSCDLFLFAKFR
jgi:hypothetical protein